MSIRGEVIANRGKYREGMLKEEGHKASEIES
jgi:hypothetical protein